jgi:hypothetical protein
VSEQSWLPCVNPWAAPYLALAEEAVGTGCRAILSGDGGNHWFDPEWLEAADLLRRLDLPALRSLWTEKRGGGTSGPSSLGVFLWRYAFRPLLMDLARATPGARAYKAAVRGKLRLALRPSWLLPDEELRAALIDDELLQVRRRGATSHRQTARDRKLEDFFAFSYVEILYPARRRLGIRFGAPATDPDLIGFLYGLPNALLNFGGRAKGLARESIARRAGEQHAELLGLAWVDAYFGRLLRSEGPRALEALGGLARLEALGIVSRGAFEQELAAPRQKGSVHYYVAWQSIASEAWLRPRF